MWTAHFTHPRSGSSHCHLLWQAAICWANGTRAPGSARSAAVSDSKSSSDSYPGSNHGQCVGQRTAMDSVAIGNRTVSSLMSSTPPPFCSIQSDGHKRAFFQSAVQHAGGRRRHTHVPVCCKMLRRRHARPAAQRRAVQCQISPAGTEHRGHADWRCDSRTHPASVLSSRLGLHTRSATREYDTLRARALDLAGAACKVSVAGSAHTLRVDQMLPLPRVLLAGRSSTHLTVSIDGGGPQGSHSHFR
eukprot:COSAG02_NODE_4192_length_5645_cov_2.530833_3_plen_246_part_00